MNTNPASTMLHSLAALKESFVHSSCKYSCLPWLFPILLWTSGLHSKRLTWHSYISKVNRLSTCWLNSLILKILRYSPPPKSLVGEGRWSRDAQYFLLVFNLKFVYPAGRFIALNSAGNNLYDKTSSFCHTIRHLGTRRPASCVTLSELWLV